MQRAKVRGAQRCEAARLGVGLLVSCLFPIQSRVDDEPDGFRNDGHSLLLVSFEEMPPPDLKGESFRSKGDSFQASLNNKKRRTE